MKCLAVIVLLALAGEEIVSARRSGGYRGGSYSSYSGSSYRSYSGYRSYYSSYRSGSGSYSSYSPSVRYSRSYIRNSYYRGYMYMYYYMYVPGSYRTTGNTYNQGASGNICKNYQANQNGTSLGVFKCPLEFEPPTHTYCCGEKELEYCCQLKDSSAVYGIIFGTLIALGVIILVVVCAVKCYSSGNRKISEGQQGYPMRQRRPPDVRGPSKPNYTQYNPHGPQRGGDYYQGPPRGGQPGNYPPPESYPPPYQQVYM